MNFKIKTITAIIAVDPATGDEGVWAFQGPNGMMMPMVIADEERLKIMLPVAEAMSKLPGAPVYRVMQFSAQQDITDTVKKRYL